MAQPITLTWTMCSACARVLCRSAPRCLCNGNAFARGAAETSLYADHLPLSCWTQKRREYLRLTCWQGCSSLVQLLQACRRQGMPQKLTCIGEGSTNTVQMLGENVVGTMLEMGRQIRGQASQPLSTGDAEGSVFLDILGAKMVCTASFSSWLGFVRKPLRPTDWPGCHHLGLRIPLHTPQSTHPPVALCVWGQKLTPNVPTTQEGERGKLASLVFLTKGMQETYAGTDAVPTACIGGCMTGGWSMQVRYPMRTGRWVHALALPVALLAVMVLPRRKGGPGRWAASGRGLALWAASTLAGIAAPAALGGLRVLLTGDACALFPT